MKLQSKNINALPGQPSTFWTTDGVNWYRTKAQAEVNDTSLAVNPDDYVAPKSTWKANKKVILIWAAVLLLLGVAFYAWHKGYITFHIHKS